jgi:hypothetical protein
MIHATTQLYRFKNHIRRYVDVHNVTIFNSMDTRRIIATTNIDALNVVKTTSLMSIPKTTTFPQNMLIASRTKLLTSKNAQFTKQLS